MHIKHRKKTSKKLAIANINIKLQNPGLVIIYNIWPRNTVGLFVTNVEASAAWWHEQHDVYVHGRPTEAAVQTCAHRSESEICCSRTSASRHMLQPSPSNAMLFISTNVLSFTRTRRTDGEENTFENLCRRWSLVLQHVIDRYITMKIWCTMLSLARQFNRMADTEDTNSDIQRSTNLKLFWWLSLSVSLSYQDFISVNIKFISPI